MSQLPTEYPRDQRERNRDRYAQRAEAAKLRIARIGQAAYLTTAEAAAYLNYGESHFRALVRAGKLPKPVRPYGPSGKCLHNKALLDQHMHALAVEQGVIAPTAA